MAIFRFPTGTRSSPDIKGFRRLDGAGLSRGKGQVVHEIPAIVYGPKEREEFRGPRALDRELIQRRSQTCKRAQAPSEAAAADAIGSLLSAGGSDDANPPRDRMRPSLRNDHQIAAASTTQAPSGSGTKNAPNVESAAGDLICRSLFIAPAPWCRDGEVNKVRCSVS